MSTADGSPRTPAHLKLDLAVKGIRLDDSVRAHADAVRSADTSGDIELILPEELWVRVPIDTGSAAGAPYVLSGSGEACTVQQNGDRIDVRLAPQPSFYGLQTS